MTSFCALLYLLKNKLLLYSDESLCSRNITPEMEKSKLLNFRYYAVNRMHILMKTKKLSDDRYRVTFHQMKNSSFSYCMDLIMLNDTNIAKAILSNCLNVYINCLFIRNQKLIIFIFIQHNCTTMSIQ